jgi:glycerol-3-phosphate dehydrogenase
LVTRSDLEAALQAPDVSELDDVRRDLRLGMGPCQAAFCAYRAAGIAQSLGRPAKPTSWLLDFLAERWRGTRPLAWGQSLRQAELTRRLYLELFAANRLLEEQTR